MKKSLIPILILIISIFSSCAEEISSDDVPTEQILRNYYVICVDGGTTYITAEFLSKAGLTIPPFREPFGLNVTLKTPSKVNFNGKEMEFSKDVFGEVSYKLRLESWPSNFKWEWIDKNGKKYSDSATMDAIKLENNCMFSDGDDFAVRWKGSSIKKDEEIAITIKDGEKTYYDTSNQVGAKKIKVTGSGYGLNLNSYYDMNISRTLIKRKVVEISEENVAGSFIKLVYTNN